MMTTLVNEGLGGLFKAEATLFKNPDDLCFGHERHEDIIRKVGCDEENGAVGSWFLVNRKEDSEGYSHSSHC